jgi:quercetin dioxygenase-like cupin family protein
MPTEPQVLYMPGGVRVEIHLTGDDTADAFCMLVDNPHPGWSLPPHVHEDAAETIHVIEGEFEITIDGETARLGPGQTVHIPAGVVHSGGNVGSSEGRRSLTFSPAGMEKFFQRVGAPERDAAAAHAEVNETVEEHGFRFVDGDGDGDTAP